MGSAGHFGLSFHRCYLPGVLYSHGEQHTLRKLPRSHRPFQHLHRRSYRLRYRLLPAVQRSSTIAVHSDPCGRGYIDCRWRHILGSHPCRRSSRIRKTQKVAWSTTVRVPPFFLPFRVNSVGLAKSPLPPARSLRLVILFITTNYKPSAKWPL